ncbi:MAG: type IV pilin protein [Rubripirellula sp.]
MSRTEDEIRSSSRERFATDRAGLSLLEFSIAAVIVGVLACIGLPSWFQSSERQRAEAAFLYLESIQTAQQRELRDHGRFLTDVTQLDIDRVSPAYFSVGDITVTNAQAPTWSLTLTRCAASNVYGPYQIAFDQSGFNPKRSNVDLELIPLDREMSK